MFRRATSHAPTHIWLGVSVESPQYLVRLKHLQQTRAAVRFVSFEPLLARVGKLSLDGVDWAIVGGESGHNARPIQPEWVRELRDQCQAQDVAFFFKQWGGHTPKARGNTTWIGRASIVSYRSPGGHLALRCLARRLARTVLNSVPLGKPTWTEIAVRDAFGARHSPIPGAPPTHQDEQLVRSRDSLEARPQRRCTAARRS